MAGRSHEQARVKKAEKSLTSQDSQLQKRRTEQKLEEKQEALRKRWREWRVPGESSSSGCLSLWRYLSSYKNPLFQANLHQYSL